VIEKFVVDAFAGVLEFGIPQYLGLIANSVHKECGAFHLGRCAVLVSVDRMENTIS
jgi:hypothetical protein